MSIFRDVNQKKTYLKFSSVTSSAGEGLPRAAAGRGRVRQAEADKAAKA